MTKPSWDERIARAEELAQSYAFAAEILRFYQEIARVQKALYARLQSAYGNKIEKRPEGSLRDELDVNLLLPCFPGLLAAVKRAGSAQLVEAADRLAHDGQSRWADLLTHHWTADAQGGPKLQLPEAFFTQALLAAYAEYLAGHTEFRVLSYGQPTCPLCQRRPQVGVLRPEGDGSKRSFVCSLCAWEWDYRRIVCPACGENDPHKLPIYSAGEFEYVRIEACQSCKNYLKTVDLTKNGLAVPVVDELATTPLNLWAQEKGYTKLEPNLLGI